MAPSPNGPPYELELLDLTPQDVIDNAYALIPGDVIEGTRTNSSPDRQLLIVEGRNYAHSVVQYFKVDGKSLLEIAAVHIMYGTRGGQLVLRRMECIDTRSEYANDPSLSPVYQLCTKLPVRQLTPEIAERLKNEAPPLIINSDGVEWQRIATQTDGRYFDNGQTRIQAVSRTVSWMGSGATSEFFDESGALLGVEELRRNELMDHSTNWLALVESRPTVERLGDLPDDILGNADPQYTEDLVGR